MKSFLRIITLCWLIPCFFFTSCLKDKKLVPSQPTEFLPNSEEVITTFKISFTDSASGSVKTHMFKDPDGPGGQSAYYGPTTTLQTDSVIQLSLNSTYYVSILLFDETKNPVDTISNEVKEEGAEHMFFYNNGKNSIMNTANPYTIQLNGSGLTIFYTDLDDGTPQRGIGMETQWRTGTSSSLKFPLNITLKHQPDSKDGTYAPGESDISVDFKLIVN